MEIPNFIRSDDWSRYNVVGERISERAHFAYLFVERKVHVGVFAFKLVYFGEELRLDVKHLRLQLLESFEPSLHFFRQAEQNNNNPTRRDNFQKLHLKRTTLKLNTYFAILEIFIVE